MCDSPLWHDKEYISIQIRCGGTRKAQGPPAGAVFEGSIGGFAKKCIIVLVRGVAVRRSKTDDERGAVAKWSFTGHRVDQCAAQGQRLGVYLLTVQGISNVTFDRGRWLTHCANDLDGVVDCESDEATGQFGYSFSRRAS